MRYEAVKFWCAVYTCVGFAGQSSLSVLWYMHTITHLSHPCCFSIRATQPMWLLRATAWLPRDWRCFTHCKARSSTSFFVAKYALEHPDGASRLTQVTQSRYYHFGTVDEYLDQYTCNGMPELQFMSVVFAKACLNQISIMDITSLILMVRFHPQPQLPRRHAFFTPSLATPCPSAQSEQIYTLCMMYYQRCAINRLRTSIDHRRILPSSSVVEYCRVEHDVSIGGRCIVSYAHVPPHTAIPDGIIIQTVPLVDGWVTFAFGSFRMDGEMLSFLD